MRIKSENFTEARKPSIVSYVVISEGAERLKNLGARERSILLVYVR